jgi:hypothetical protein
VPLGVRARVLGALLEGARALLEALEPLLRDRALLEGF